MTHSRAPLLAHVYWGDPNEMFSLALATTLLENGADMLEIGIPYTDPLCDGEIFQRVCQRALAGGTTPNTVFSGIATLRRKRIRQPIYLTSYFGPLFALGVERAFKRAKEAGVNGLIIPDILLEEQGELREAADQFGLSVIQFATVYSSFERLRRICRASTDFIYCIALPGVTGDARRDRNTLHTLLRTLKSITPLPVFVGFGIKSAGDAEEILSFGADGVIVGSALAAVYEQYVSAPFRSLGAVSSFLHSLKTW